MRCAAPGARACHAPVAAAQTAAKGATKATKATARASPHDLRVRSDAPTAGAPERPGGGCAAAPKRCAGAGAGPRLAELEQAPELAVLQLLAHVAGQRRVARRAGLRRAAAQHRRTAGQRPQRVRQERIVLQPQPLAVLGVRCGGALQLRGHRGRQPRVHRVRDLPARGRRRPGLGPGARLAGPRLGRGRWQPRARGTAAPHLKLGASPECMLRAVRPPRGGRGGGRGACRAGAHRTDVTCDAGGRRSGAAPQSNAPVAPVRALESEAVAAPAPLPGPAPPGLLSRPLPSLPASASSSRRTTASRPRRCLRAATHARRQAHGAPAPPGLAESGWPAHAGRRRARRGPQPRRARRSQNGGSVGAPRSFAIH